tara:strand:- start:676 stop:987 length:312 start_codon:yes stop_codon:yes gene_type:complete
MKLISFLCLSIFLFSKPVISETILTRLEVLQKRSDCLQNPENKTCEKLILLLEQKQLYEFEQSRFKCQSSILGLQTEIVEAYFFKEVHKRQDGIMIPYVFKNC